jgi:ABC-type transport system substrate-binding protein
MSILRGFAWAATACWALCAAAPAALAAPTVEAPAKAQPQKVMRYAFRIAENGFDPAQISDIYSRTVTAQIFEAPFQYDPLARPVKVRPNTAAAMPEHSADFRVWTVKLKPGIYFASDPAFKGQRRELVAEDYVYSFKRFADPANKSPVWTWLQTFEFLGLSELRQEALDSKQPFNYDKPIAGLRALDRYTVQFSMKSPNPRFITGGLTAPDLLGAVAREVVEFYGDKIMEHPVGTGPFKLAQWRRSSFIALDRSPEFRELFYEAEPAPDDAVGQAILKQMKGRKLPMLDRVEVSIVEENQPRWLSFLQAQADFLEEVPPEFISVAMPGGQVAPNLAKRGVQGYRMIRADVAFTFFNMEDATVGGYTPDKVALRRAISLAIDVEREIRLVRRGQAIVAQGPVMPNTDGYDPNFKSEHGEYNVAKAKALLDLYGYVDKNGDGWRDMPDGSPLVLKKATTPDQVNRQIDEQFVRNMKAIGVRIEFITGKFQEHLKAARNGKLMMWLLGTLAADPDSLGTFQRYDSKQIGGSNYARFKLPEMDALYKQMDDMPDGPERLKLLRQAERLAVAYAPYKTHAHRYINDMAQPWVQGYRRPVFWYDWWSSIDIDTSKLPRP